MTDDSSIELKGNQPDVIDATGSAHKVEAVAGSGKTTTMVERLRKEIQTRGTPPSRLLVLTFANEASHTIQDKLRDALGPHDAFEVDVYTYHSFAYQLLRDHAYYLGVSPEFELVTKEDRPKLLESVYEEVDFSFVAPDSPSVDSTNDRNSGFSDLETFVKCMRREAVAPDNIRAYLPADDDLRDLLRLIEALREMASEVIGVDENDLWSESDEIAERCDQLARVYHRKADEFDVPDRIYSVVSDHLEAMGDTAENAADHFRATDNLAKAEELIPEVLFDDNQIKSVEQTPMGRLSEFVHMLRRSRAFVDAYDAYIGALDDRGAFDYDELIHEAVSLLRDEEVRDDILGQWDAVYCDEFQDTDESQLELVRELRDELDIMVVGDSDQAIHEWRGQDPENMSNLPDSFEEQDLGLNFRSRQPILDLTNNLGRGKQSIESDRDPAPPNVFRVDSEEERTTEQVSTSISNLLTGRFEDVTDRDLSDIAVLVRGNKQARDVADQLDADSIPYTLSNDTASDLSQGLRTVLSYLRILVSPGDDVSWQRVLLHLYRVPEADVDALLRAGETVPEGYDALARAGDAEDRLEAPDAVAEAMADYETLQAVSATHSISELYLHLKRETRIEWFLRDVDRDALHNVERLISSFDDSPVQSRLTDEFVTHLERRAHLLAGGDDTATSTGPQSDDAVDVMTIHQAKGLDFDTVLLPFLTEEDFGHITLDRYQEKLHNYDVLVEDVAGELDDPLRDDLRDSQVAEEWRVLHVAITRAKENLFLFGNDVSDDDPTARMIDDLLAGDDSDAPIRWSSEGPRMRVWEALTDSYDRIADENPDAVRDYTDVVNRGVDEDPGTITYYEQVLSTDDALEKTLTFADRVVAGTLADADTDTSQFADAPLGQELDVELSRQHSHTALEAVRDCERKHVLDYVVGAFSDPRSGSGSASSGNHRADVGSLFHDVAERAYWRDYDDIAEWKEACRRLARSNDRTHVLDATLDCIDRYFETRAVEWEAVGAEVPIELTDLAEVDGPVTGYMDSVREYPDGGLAVIDYKTSYAKKTLAESHQLQLYLRACEEFDAEVTHAGYVYVGEAGPDTQLFTAAELAEMWTDLREDLRKADSSSFDNYTPGPHCRYCEHRSLGCAPDEFRVE
ncbi:ATP-dependent helicase [Halorussus lipolyticus]|uniref:ATP-dependent helicase n=1 Tax=Halorussus lipolyticus TaxID=3034024 RepID=UPI0023E82764|nr:UvrD-helicase domain-containing protein [Halorussus sp. DT80]